MEESLVQFEGLPCTTIVPHKSAVVGGSYGVFGLRRSGERVAGDRRCCASILGSSLPPAPPPAPPRPPLGDVTRSSCCFPSTTLGFRIGGGRFGRPSRALLVARGSPLWRLRFIATSTTSIKTGWPTVLLLGGRSTCTRGSRKWGNFERRVRGRWANVGIFSERVRP